MNSLPCILGYTTPSLPGKEFYGFLPKNPDYMVSLSAIFVNENVSNVRKFSAYEKTGRTFRPSGFYHY
jgi:hypothetical protein